MHRMSDRLRAYAMLFSSIPPEMLDELVPPLPKPKPKGYGVHIPKAQRRGKTPEQIATMRAAMAEQEETDA